MKAPTLRKIILEAVLLCEKANLYVHYICTDGGSWNRAMWHNMGVHGNAKHVRRKVTHPCDNKSFLRFISDFPHLVKCVRNIMIKHGFNTHKGRVILYSHNILKCRVPGNAGLLTIMNSCRFFGNMWQRLGRSTAVPSHWKLHPSSHVLTYIPVGSKRWGSIWLFIFSVAYLSTRWIFTKKESSNSTQIWSQQKYSSTWWLKQLTPWRRGFQQKLWGMYTNWAHFHVTT